MKLKILFFLLILQFSKEKKEFQVIGRLSKDKPKSTTMNGYCVYIDTSEFEEDKEEIEFRSTVYKGEFTEDFMHYKGSNNEELNGTTVNFSLYKKFDSSSSKGYDDNYYKKFSYNFKIPKSKEKFLYIAFPYFKGKDNCYAEISIYTSFPLWAIILIVIAGIVFIGIIILVVYCIIKSKKNEINNNEEFTPIMKGYVYNKKKGENSYYES